jgi:hypothetical protein
VQLEKAAEVEAHMKHNSTPHWHRHADYSPPQTNAYRARAAWLHGSNMRRLPPGSSIAALAEDMDVAAHNATHDMQHAMHAFQDGLRAAGKRTADYWGDDGGSGEAAFGAAAGGYQGRRPPGRSSGTPVGDRTRRIRELGCRDEYKDQIVDDRWKPGLTYGVAYQRLINRECFHCGAPVGSDNHIPQDGVMVNCPVARDGLPVVLPRKTA